MKNHLNIKEWSFEERPREKLLLKGKAELSIAELIAIIIGSGSQEESAVALSKRILNSVNNDLHELANLELEEFLQFKGVGEAKAVSISAALELGRRRKMAISKEKTQLSSSREAFDLMEPHIGDLKHEEFWVLLLNRANRLIEIRNMSKGGVSGTVADAKLIFKAALSKLASSIIVCHNHPSGNLKPSRADQQLTAKLVAAGKNLDIAVLDHLIIGNNSYFSFADEGLI